MILAYCFIGTLPSYAIDTIHQARLFYDGEIYFIVSDYTSEYLQILREKYNVTIINYDDISSTEFNDTINKYINKFEIVPNLKGREKLFIYSFERFFLLYNLMDKHNISNAFFVELDNLLYDDPRKWEEQFSKKDCAFMYDHNERCASGIFYVKNKETLFKINNSFLDYITYSSKFMSEMGALYEFWNENKDIIQILPTIWSSPTIPNVVHENYDKFNNTIFDAAALGIYLGGMDPHHTHGVIIKGLKWHHSLLDYSIYKYEWRLDEQERNVPFVFNTDNNMWIKINNLHIHSKQLADCLSKQL